MQKLNIPQQTVLNECIKQKGNIINDSGDITLSLSTHRNSSDSSNRSLEKAILFSKIAKGLRKIDDTSVEDFKKRKDIFGREIKKKGKHKVSFADELDIVKSFIPTPKNKSIPMKHDKYSSAKNLQNYFPRVESRKRHNSFNSGRISMLKNIYNMTKVKTISNKNFNESIADIIKVQNLKKENKLNTFTMKKLRDIAEEESVCCSCYCSIW